MKPFWHICRHGLVLFQEMFCNSWTTLIHAALMWQALHTKNCIILKVDKWLSSRVAYTVRINTAAVKYLALNIVPHSAVFALLSICQCLFYFVSLIICVTVSILSISKSPKSTYLIYQCVLKGYHAYASSSLWMIMSTFYVNICDICNYNPVRDFLLLFENHSCSVIKETSFFVN